MSAPSVMQPAPSTRAPTVAEEWNGFLRPVVWVQAALVAALFFAAFWNPIRYGMVAKWLNDGNWSHGWLIPAFSMYFLATRRDQLLACRPRPNYWGALILAASLGIYLFSAWQLRMSYPQALAVVGALFGLTLLFGGLPVLRIAWFPIAFLLLAVPLPQGLYVDLTMPLRRLASAVAAAVMPLLVPGLHTEAQAVVIDYVTPGRPPGTLNVEEACSGMRSIMAFITLGVAIAYLNDRPVWHRVVLLANCVPIALLCNSLRVTITGLLHVTGREDWATGTPHALLGMLTFGIALGLFSLVGFVLNRLWTEADE